jgi:hypothetical protein
MLMAGLIAGCGGDDEPETRTVTVTVTPEPGQEQPADVQETATPSPDGEATTASEGIASAEGGADGHRFRFVLTELTRTADTVTLGARMEILSDEDTASIQISALFNDGEFQDLNDSTDNETSHVFDGVALIDPQARKKYLVARDETGRCVCSTDLSSVFVKPDAPANLQATITAPPPDVKTVNVFVPNVKTFTNVPISG